MEELFIVMPRACSSSLLSMYLRGGAAVPFAGDGRRADAAQAVGGAGCAAHD
jgi:hypothetical protein